MKITKTLALQILEVINNNSTILAVEELARNTNSVRDKYEGLVAHQPKGKLVFKELEQEPYLNLLTERDVTTLDIICNLGIILDHFKVNIRYSDNMIKLECYLKKYNEVNIHLMNVTPNIIIDIQETNVVVYYKTEVTDFYTVSFDRAISTITRVRNRVVNHLRAR